MSLPTEYGNDFDTYFTNVLTFLDSYKYFVNTSNVEILAKDVFQHIPIEWKRFILGLSVNEISNLVTIENKGPLMKYFENLKKLLPDLIEEPNVIMNQDILPPCLNKKKQHEISQFAEIIYKQSIDCGVKHIIDLGSGLGYLCQLLHSSYGLKVLGVEADTNKLNAAIKRQEKFHQDSRHFVKYVQKFITYNSDDFLVKSMNKSFGENEFLIVGLHACADLSVDALKLCIKIDWCKGLLLMPCCYHKMKQIEIGNDLSHIQNFQNFPLSDCLKRNSVEIFTRPFLRLACQHSQRGWKQTVKNDEEARVFHLMCRAVLELYAFKENGQLVKHGKRKVFNRKLAVNNNFQAFLDQAVQIFAIKQNSSKQLAAQISNSNESHNEAKEQLHELKKTEILDIWNSLTDEDFKYVLFYTVMQDSLQLLCENIVLLDKLYFVQKQNVNIRNMKYVKITDESISPRCFALLLEK